MIDMAGQTPPASHSGRSLVPLLQGRTPSEWRTDFLCEFLAVPNTIPRWEGVRDVDWVYARYYVDRFERPPFEFLHDLKNDPDQLVNIATLPDGRQTETHRKALAMLRTRCDELISQNGPAMKNLPTRPGRQRPNNRAVKKAEAP
jgi:hypothetical protein